MTDPEQLLRRTFAAHEADVDPQALRRIAAALTLSPRPRESRMSHDGDTTAGLDASPDSDTAANAGPAAHPGPDPRRRRWIPWLVGVAAGLAVVAVLIGVFGRGADQAPTPATTTYYSPLPSRPGELSTADRRTVLDRIDDALRRHGTLRATMALATRYEDSSDNGTYPEAVYRPYPVELDVRDPVMPRWRVGQGATLIGTERWELEPAGDRQLRWQKSTLEEPLPRRGLALMALMWVEDDADRAVVIGEETADGRRLVHYQFAATIGDGGETLPPDTGKDDGRGRLDVWVADDGTIVRGSMRHDFDETRAESIEYGADVHITPPPQGELATPTPVPARS